MPRREDIDSNLRTRLAKWTVWFKKEYGIESDRAFARRIDKASPTVANLLNHGSGGGLDYLAALHKTFGKSADTLLDADPPDPVELPASHPAHHAVEQPTPEQHRIANPPRFASSLPPAARRKKKSGGGSPA